MRYTESVSNVNLKLSVPISYYAFALISAILSSCQLTVLPDLQLVLIFLLIVLRVSPEVIVLCLISILCTSVYAIPDPVLRSAPQDYPSIYTKGYGGVRLFDLLVVILFFYALPKLKELTIHKRLFLLYGVFFVSMISLLFNQFIGLSNYSYFFFGARNALVAVSFSLLLTRLMPERIPPILVFSMFCWICKMLFMILLPSDNVIEREIFGIPWKIFFAGDEYLSFMLICAITLCVGINFYTRKKLKSVCYFMCFLALVLALISQRKGAVPYFFFCFIMIFCFDRGALYRSFFTMVLFVYTLGMYFVSGPAYEFLPGALTLSLNEYHVLYQSAISSISHLMSSSPISSIFGIGPAGLYEVFDLPLESDHIFSFGTEVGEKYRYAIWAVPFDRLFLNAGIIGGGLTVLYIISILVRGRGVAYLYMSFSIIPLFGLYGLTPVSAIFVGFALYALTVKISPEIIENHILDKA
ncbi:hypothetical protein QF016_000248 [Pseudomonas marginalis]|nr:hypothetical protein [Pseudomonas marginalis]